MLCRNCEGANKKEATCLLWCPTWISADLGPMPLCDKHSANFRPEVNGNARDGSWHWGEEAEKAFRQCGHFMRSTTERIQHTAMLALLERDGKEAGRMSMYSGTSRVFIMDGQAWLVACYHICCLGEEQKARETFPALFLK